MLERVADSSSDVFVSCIEILAQSIPVNEQLSTERITTLLAGGDYRLYSFRFDNEIVGMALVYLPQRHAFAWLDYMAIRADRRAQGLGTQMFGEIVKIANRERTTAGWLFLEVDDDRQGSDEVRRMNKRRIEFYRRLGAQLLANVAYCFPGRAGTPVPMRLMAYRLQAGGGLSQQSLSSAVEEVFVQIHDRPKDDSLLHWVLDRMPSVMSLE